MKNMLPTMMRLMTVKPFKGKRGPEDLIAIEWANRLRGYTLEGRLVGCWTHVANEVGGGGGSRAAIRYALAKAMGMISGTPDFVFTKHDRALWVEVKTRTGKLSDSQKDFAAWAKVSGVDVHVVRSADEGDNLLRERGFLDAAREAWPRREWPPN